MNALLSLPHEIEPFGSPCWKRRASRVAACLLSSPVSAEDLVQRVQVALHCSPLVARESVCAAEALGWIKYVPPKMWIACDVAAQVA